MELVEQAIQMDARSRQELTDAMKRMTALENPNSVQQMKQWLSDNGMETDSLGKKVVAELLKTAPPELAEVLTLRQQLTKSSVRKYQAMEKTVCSDNRARGMFMFYGANRTGRFSGRNIQLQNLPQNHLPDLAEARALVRSGDFDAVELLYEDVPDTLSQLIRTAFIPRDGAQFLVADFSAIEARVIAWFAGETWRQEVFSQGGDIYCASASQMFKVPVEKHGINGHLRQKGKIAELALGYGGSVGALKAMGALEMGLTEEELPQLVDAWRQSNPNIVKFWWAVDRAVMEAVRYKHTTTDYGLTFSCRSGMLFITLPSGRKLAYVKPKVGTNKFGGECITYEGMDIAREECVNQADEHILNRVNYLDFHFVAKNHRGVILVHCPSSLSSEIYMPAVISSTLLANSSKAGAIFKTLPSRLLSGCSSLTGISSRGVSESASSSAQSQSIEAPSSLARSIRFCVSGFLTSLSQSDTA